MERLVRKDKEKKKRKTFDFFSTFNSFLVIFLAFTFSFVEYFKPIEKF